MYIRPDPIALVGTAGELASRILSGETPYDARAALVVRESTAGLLDRVQALVVV